MEKGHTKTALKKFVKATSSQTAAATTWSSNGRAMIKEEARDRSLDKSKLNAIKNASKSPAKENTKPQDFKFHTGERALKRAMFNYSVAVKFYFTELQKKQTQKIQKMVEEEEVRSLRKEMTPKAQLMPFFDRPFLPQRSTRPLTMPREPRLRGKCWNCVCNTGLYSYQPARA